MMLNLRQYASKLWSHTLLRHHIILNIVTFLLVLPFACKDIRYSVYFHKWQSSNQAKKFIRAENDQRLQRAEEYFKNVPFYDINRQILSAIGHEDVGKISVALSVITVSRNRHVVDSYQPKYLTQVLWRLLDLANKSSELIQSSNYAFRISLCNVDFDPSNYNEIKSLSNFTIHQRFSEMSFSLDHPLEKEKQDYVYCLNSSLSLHSTDYAFLLEDDAYPLDDFFPVLLDTLNHFSSSLDHTHDASPAYVKFFHPERLSTFADVVSIIELISWVLLSGTVLHVTYCCFRPLPLSTHSSWLLCFFYALLFALAINRPGLMELRRLTPSLYALLPAPSCCTPAMLFPKSSANAIVSFLQSKTCENNLGKDSILDEFLEFSNLNAYVVQPNVVMHIGMYSALRQNIVDPFLM